MEYAAYFILGVVTCYLLTGVYVLLLAEPLNRFFLEDRQTSIFAVLTWPFDLRRVIKAGLSDADDLLARPNLNKGHPQ
ncbi:MAG: hypothetical protein EHM78_02185 [Myxococcaceae bacterium]|nr:MAG: hypothetical protein EHM78_02185 [Myxococcaceae bacterium]